MLICFWNHKAAYESRISDWRSDVCSSYLIVRKLRKHGEKYPQPFISLGNEAGDMALRRFSLLFHIGDDGRGADGLQAQKSLEFLALIRNLDRAFPVHLIFFLNDIDVTHVKMMN